LDPQDYFHIFLFGNGLQKVAERKKSRLVGEMPKYKRAEEIRGNPERPDRRSQKNVKREYFFQEKK
jgi:hypothetical protein